MENFKKKPSWALPYQEWQSYIISCQVNHDVGIEAAATGNKESDSSTDDSDESVKTSSDEMTVKQVILMSRKQKQIMFAIGGK